MQKIFAIAMLTLRSAFRSKLVLTLLLLLTTIIIVLPLTIKGDGTLAGRTQILLSYCLGLVTVLLSMACVWYGSAGIAGEISDQSLQMVTVKPIRRGGIWLGKWLGLLSLNALMLTFSGVVIYALLQFSFKNTELTPDDQRIMTEEIMVARRLLAPEANPQVEEKLQKIWRQAQAEGQVRSDIPLDAQYEQLKTALYHQYHTLKPGETRRWKFQLPENPNAGHPVFIHYKINSSKLGASGLAGRWSFIDAQGETRATVEVKQDTNSPQQIKIPEGVDDLNRSTLVYENLSTQDEIHLFSMQSSPSLLYQVDSFEINFLRCLLLIFTQLALFSAIGLTAGTLFSTPVAVFFAMSLIAMQQFSQFGENSVFAHSPDDGHNHGAGGFDPVELFPWFYKFLNLLVHPFKDIPAIESISTGMLIPWSAVGYAWGIKFFLYTALLGLLACWLFNRREIGMAE